MDPFLLQKQIKDNASDLQDFCKDLKLWKDEMDSKENPNKKEEEKAKIKQLKAKISPKSKKTEKNKTKECKPREVTDYSSWDKYDFDGACARLDVDSSNESDISDEIDETKMVLAKEEKEKGNEYVKLQKWDDAIVCYTNAIDAYAYDPVFYANRALCLLKKADYKKAELDCTIALKLDSSYAKAYHRRALAKENQNLLTDAHNDLLQVLKLEPNNKDSRAAIDRLEKKLGSIVKPTDETPRPVSKFTQLRRKLMKPTPKNDLCVGETTEPIKPHVYERKQRELERPQSDIKQLVWPQNSDTDDDIELIEPISKPPRLRSKKPLKRATITDLEFPIQTKPSYSHSSEEDTEDSLVDSKNEENQIVPSNWIKINYEVPQTAMQFNCNWRLMRGTICKKKYLLQIDPNMFEEIFKESLDANVFGEMIRLLDNAFKCKEITADGVYRYLLGLTKVKRFSTLILFMDKADKMVMSQLMEDVEQTSEVLTDDVEQLKLKYEL